MYRSNRQRHQSSIQQSATDLPSVGRAALILYSIRDDGIFILLGSGANGLTTLGGRTEPSEMWLDCLIREIKEETRGILDYSKCKKMFLSPPTKVVIYGNCAYAFYPTEMSVLIDTAKEFLHTKSSQTVCNEMASLEIISIDELIEELVRQYNSDADTLVPRIVCSPAFRSMFLDMGYDTLKGNICNFITENVSIEADMFCKINELPQMICLTPIDHKLPAIYGHSRTQGVFITDQFYFERNGMRLFRSGWHKA